jgi:hypothetical protein
MVALFLFLRLCFSGGSSNPFAGETRTYQRGAMEHVIGGKYKLGRKIGSGSFGELYLGTFLRVLCTKWLCFVNQESVFILLSLVCLDSGVNIQNGEEVGIKLVRAHKPCCNMYNVCI